MKRVRSGLFFGAATLLAALPRGASAMEIPSSSLAGGRGASATSFAAMAERSEVVEAHGVAAPKDAHTHAGLGRGRCEYLTEKNAEWWSDFGLGVGLIAVPVLALAAGLPTHNLLWAVAAGGMGAIAGFATSRVGEQLQRPECDEIEWTADDRAAWARYVNARDGWKYCLESGGRKRRKSILGWSIGGTISGGVIGLAAAAPGQAAVSALGGAVGGYVLGGLLGRFFADKPPYGCGFRPEYQE